MLNAASSNGSVTLEGCGVQLLRACPETNGGDRVRSCPRLVMSLPNVS